MNTFPFPLLLVAATVVAAPAVLAQIRVEPGAAAKQAPTLEQALAKFRDPASWADGFRGLLACARQEQQAVLEAIAPLVQPGADADLTARARLLIEAIAVQHGATEKREELRQRFRRVGDAAADVAKALGADASEAQKQAVAALQAAVATMQKNLQVEAPMAPTPLRVPVGKRTAGDDKAAGERQADGYTEIEVDGKKMLVPADALPPGTSYEAEMTERGLVVKKKAKAGDAGKDDGKKEDDGKGGGKDQPKPGGDHGKKGGEVPAGSGG